ncbi:CYCR1 [Auxenochlorella protothecoides x Auxenochlorella symbiontica]
MRHGPGTPAATTGQLIRAVGDVLSLPHRTVVTALYLYWRLQLATEEEGAGEGTAWTQERILPTVVFLAAKVEETCLVTNDLLNVASLLCASPSAYQRPPPDPLATPPPALVGGTYYAAKALLVLDEQRALRTLRFDLRVHHPHPHLLALAGARRAPRPLLAAALCLLGDALAGCACAARHRPGPLASAALHVASVLIVPRQRDGGPPCEPGPLEHGWWRALGLCNAQVEAALDEVAGVAEAGLAGMGGECMDGGPGQLNIAVPDGPPAIAPHS